MPRNFGKYRLESIGRGAETEAFRPENTEKGKEGKKNIVLKNMASEHEWVPRADGSDPEGFDQGMKEILEGQYRALKAEYGSIIPQARIIKNPDNPERYLIAQQYIETADPATLTEWYPADIENEDLQKSLASFVKKLKENVARQEQGEEVVLPDMKDENFVLSKDESAFYYVDSGVVQMGEVDEYDLTDIARMELLSGANPTDFARDPFYRKIFDKMEEKGIDVEDPDNVSEWYSALIEFADRLNEEAL